MKIRQGEIENRTMRNRGEDKSVVLLLLSAHQSDGARSSELNEVIHVSLYKYVHAGKISSIENVYIEFLLWRGIRS